MSYGLRASDAGYNILDIMYNSRTDVLPMAEDKKKWVYSTIPDIPKKFNRKGMGRWLLFVHDSLVDAVWESIKDATERGVLGVAARCATIANQQMNGSQNKAICVYTKNYQNVNDVMRVRDKLRELGFTYQIAYTTDLVSIDEEDGLLYYE